MILKDGQKWACRSCITGHRSSRCTHAERELFPIAKKGRPSSHCKVCREAGIPSSSNEPPPPGCTCQAKRKARASIPSAPGSISPDDVLPNGPSGTKGSGRVRDKRRKESQDSLNSQTAHSLSGASDTSRQSSPGQSHLNMQYAQYHNGSTAGQIPPSLPPPHPPPQSMAEQQHLYHYQHLSQQMQHHGLPPLSHTPASASGYAGPAGISQDAYSAHGDAPWWSHTSAGYPSQYQMTTHDRHQHDDMGSSEYSRYNDQDPGHFHPAADGQHGHHHPAGMPWSEQQQQHHVPHGAFLPYPQQSADQSHLSHNALNYRSSYYHSHPEGDGYSHAQQPDAHAVQYHSHEPLPGAVPQPAAHSAGSAPWPSSSSFDGYYPAQPTVKPRDYESASHNTITITPPNGLAAARTDSSESVLDVKPDISGYHDAAVGDSNYDDHYRRQDHLQALHHHHHSQAAPEPLGASGGYMQATPLEDGVVNMTGDTGTYQGPGGSGPGTPFMQATPLEDGVVNMTGDTGTYQGPGGSGPGTPFMQLRIPDHKRKFSQ